MTIVHIYSNRSDSTQKYYDSPLTSTSRSINISVQETGHDFDAGSVRKLSACGNYILLQRDNGVAGEALLSSPAPGWELYQVQKSLDTHTIHTHNERRCAA